MHSREDDGIQCHAGIFFKHYRAANHALSCQRHHRTECAGRVCRSIVKPEMMGKGVDLHVCRKSAIVADMDATIYSGQNRVGANVDVIADDNLAARSNCMRLK